MSASPKSGSGKAVVTTPNPREIRVERVFDAPRARVWEAMTTPALLAKWWGRGNPVTVERHELARGGHWRFVERAPDGELHGFEGRFREVDAPARLEQTFEWDGMPGHPCVNLYALEELEGGRTRLVGLTLFFTVEERDGMLASGMEAGMNASYDALDRVLAG